jgi:hypothetical protein
MERELLQGEYPDKREEVLLIRSPLQIDRQVLCCLHRSPGVAILQKNLLNLFLLW